ncbi:MAG: T9SS type A sorting domain-containing protein [Lewinellaceae bacterium]|nr:T9SS type A sorting domain-containing protein [Phaeodactylibacter sp.]MCB9350190.1 T9SS type A sorting domain-containing protein [Lewinellaceae bacterium]
MKIVATLILLFTISFGYGQTLPIDFETSIVTSDFEDFDGGAASVIANPQSSGINTSATVAQIIRNGGPVWAGSKLALANNLDFSTLNTISMKVFTTAPVGTIIKFKLEGSGETDRDVQTTVTNEWETLKWDFTGQPANFNFLVFMFDFGNVGDGSATSTFLFDDIEQLFGGTQIELPVDFEGSTVNYTMSDFGGAISSLVTDPTDAGNSVMQTIKPVGAAAWAGTTIGTPAGFATNIPLTLTASKMTVRVWSPDAGTPIRLKVENSNDPTHTCETETNTTVSEDWETLEFDFTNQAPGTELLSVGLNMGWTYNMASIFFNFDTDGAAAGEKTYYFDDVKFGALALGIRDQEIEGLSVFPNPTNDQWTISSENADILLIEVFDLGGKLHLSLKPNSRTANINASNLADGIYVSKISTHSGTSIVRLINWQL